MSNVFNFSVLSHNRAYVTCFVDNCLRHGLVVACNENIVTANENILPTYRNLSYEKGNKIRGKPRVKRIVRKWKKI